MQEALAAANFTNVTFTEPYAEVQAEFEEMCASVKEYGGFYIARYEAGIDDSGSGISTYASAAPTNYNVVSKKGATVYNYVPWVDSEEGQKGAVTLSKEMAKNNNYDASVVTTLCYGVQWDAAMKFVKKAGYDVENDSSSWGNTSDSAVEGAGELLPTGYNDAWSSCNIYDLAGNVSEWTMEYASFTYNGANDESPVDRGGHYYYSGSVYPAAVRVFDEDGPSSSYYNVGFRPTLYIVVE